MTGPGEGKIALDAKVFLNDKSIEAEVYIHKKGFSRAAVTHLDIESPELNIMESKGGFFDIIGTGSGIEIDIQKDIVRIESQALAQVLPEGKKTRTWVGQKLDGIFVGFKRNEMLKLEEVVEEYERWDNSG